MNISAEWAAVLIAGVAAVASLSNIFFTSKIMGEISRTREWTLTNFAVLGSNVPRDFLCSSGVRG